MNNSKQMDILLVEDNQNDVELTLRALDKHGLANKVLVVKDGAEALEYLFATGKYVQNDPRVFPCVVILDLKLPKVSGIDVLRRIKGDECTRSIPVVVLTSSAEERDVIESYKLGANSYIIKPVDFDKFIHAVSQVGLYWLIINHPPII
ncbi:MAG: response regulator [bacterium]